MKPENIIICDFVLFSLSCISMKNKISPDTFLHTEEKVKNYDQSLLCSAGTLSLWWFHRSHWKQLGLLFHVSGGFFRAAGLDMGAEYSVLNVRSSCYHLLDENLMDEQQ